MDSDSNQTKAVRLGLESDPNHGSVVPPIHLSTNYTFKALGERRTFDYSRSGNPTRQILADAICALEGGAWGVITATGMAAVTVVLHSLKPGDRVVASHDCYGGTQRLLNALHARGMLRVQYVNTADLKALEQALTQPTALLWLETPSNPLLNITDIEASVALARTASASQATPTRTAVDNTFLSPLWQQPLNYGADVVVHSTTKYINGHSDVVGGALVAATTEWGEELGWWANCLGLTGGAFDSYQTLRGLRTLDARLRIHDENAQAVVEALRHHPAVKKVYYPGLADHPGHAIAKRQQRTFGAMVSFSLNGGKAAAATVCDRLRLFSLAESLGGVESLVAHPASMTHASMSPEQQRAAGFGDDLLRLSVGIEHGGDLVADLRAALDAL